jgi:hypothetical protein
MEGSDHQRTTTTVNPDGSVTVTSPGANGGMKTSRVAAVPADTKVNSDGGGTSEGSGGTIATLLDGTTITVSADGNTVTTTAPDGRVRCGSEPDEGSNSSARTPYRYRTM